MAQAASRVPPAPPSANSSTLSVTSWRTSRPRPAPMARRTAISRVRPEARARRTFATLALAISSTIIASRRSIPRNPIAGSTADAGSGE